MTDTPPAPPILGMYQTSGTFPTPGPSAWPSGATTNLAATYIAWGQDWATYAGSFITQCNNNGIVPFVELEAWHAGTSWNQTPLFTDITGGAWDSWLEGIGTFIASTGKTCILTFAHEMNVSGQYPWSHGDTGSGPGGGALTAAEWIAGWKYVRAKVNSTANGHALWMWACSAWTGGTTVDPSPWWPGSSFVDMVGIDGYPNTQYGSSLGTFAGQIQPTVTAIRNLGWTNPIFLSETNLAQMVASGGESIASFVADMATAGCSGILEFEDAAWRLPQMSSAQWTAYNAAIATHYSGGGGGGTSGDTYQQSVIDNFNDNSFNTSLWSTPNGTTGITETSGTLHINATNAYAAAGSPATFDISKGILGVKVTRSGTATNSDELYILAIDGSGNSIQYGSDPSISYYYWDKHGATTHSNDVATDGVGTSWVDGQWIGIGNYTPSTGIIHAYKSPDGQTWTEIGRTTVAGTFGYTAVGIGLMAGNYASSPFNFTAVFDDPSTFILGTVPTPPPTSYTQTVIDNFNDNSFNTSLWSTPDGTTGIAETSGALHISSVSSYPNARCTTLFNITAGILAVKVSHSGTPAAESEVYIGVQDAAGNGAFFLSDPQSGYSTILAANGSATTVSSVSVTGAINSSWTDGTWLGIGMSGTTLTVYKSTDGQTWTSIGTATIGGTFDHTAAGIVMVCGYYGSSSSSYVTIFDDASFWTPSSSSTTVKVRVGGAWVTAVLKVRVEGAWVIANPKARVGGAWVALS